MESDSDTQTQTRTTVALKSPYDVKRVQCAGLQFLKYLTETRPIDGGHLSHSSSADKISENDLEFEIDVDYLRSLDPKDWKNQDHYAVLGIKKLRFDATDDDIKRAYRKIVLKHHPDKRKAQGEDIRQEDDYFSCITKAYETLGVPQKRRSYDSIDPEFDDLLPTQSEVEKEFFESLTDLFKKNARWSEKKRVPLLGDDDTERKNVETFYDFWYNFQSWREFSYLDEEDKDKGQDREERRWIDKQNKAIRAKRKKEEMARIRSLVDLAYNNDPRVVRFKREDKEKKLAAKRAKQDAAQAQKAEEERQAKELVLAKQQKAEAEQKRIETIQKEKEQQKRAWKKEKKLLRDTAKSNEYYTKDDKERLKHLEGVEKICESMKLLELQEFNKDLQSGGRDIFTRVLEETEAKLEEERKALFSNAPKTVVNNIPNNAGLKVVNRKALWNHDNVQLLIKAVNLFPAGTISRWDVIANYLNQHGTELLDMKFYAKDILNKAKELQSGDFSKSDLKQQVNQQAYEAFEKNRKELKVVDKSDISVNLDENKNDANSTNLDGRKKQPAQLHLQNGMREKEEKEKEKQKELVKEKEKVKEKVKEKAKEKEKKEKEKEKDKGKEKEKVGKEEEKVPVVEIKMNGHAEDVEMKPPTEEAEPQNAAATTNELTGDSKKDSKIWSKDEQALLEQAIKTYPISTQDRWERIAECIPNRTKKECLRRVKELVDRVNAKREAQQIVK